MLYTIKIIKNHFEPNKMLTLFTSNFYSIHYYNSEIWHILNLNLYLKNLLLSKFSNALKIFTPVYVIFEITWDQQQSNPWNFFPLQAPFLLHWIYNFKTPSQNGFRLISSKILIQERKPLRHTTIWITRLAEITLF